MSEFKDLKMLYAAEMAKNPSIADNLQGKFRTLWDTGFTGGALNNLEKAMNIMATRGWIPKAMTAYDGARVVYVIMEKKE